LRGGGGRDCSCESAGGAAGEKGGGLHDYDGGCFLGP